MQSYLNLLRDVIDNGEPHSDRTGVGTLSVFGRQWRHDMRSGFPLVTTREIVLQRVFEELRWFLSGSTNINDLHPCARHWWAPWADPEGGLGRVYGAQLRGSRSWSRFMGQRRAESFDQLAALLDGLRDNPFSRRHIMTTWNPFDMQRDAQLPCCHGLVIQFKVHHDGGLSLSMYQRSADLFLGVPANMASYGLLLLMVAEVTGYTPRDLVITFGDMHLYSNHIDKAKLQLSREPHPLPLVDIPLRPVGGSPLEQLLAIQWFHIRLDDYKHHPRIAAKVAV